MENGTYHRKGLVILKNKDKEKLQGGNKKVFIIGLDNQEVSQRYEVGVEIPPKENINH